MAKSKHVGTRTVYEVLLHERCPTCGKTLELKNGPYGPFVRCSSYPSCIFKKSLSYLPAVAHRR